MHPTSLTDPPATHVDGREPASAPWLVRGRDLRLDLLRGLAVLVVVVNHAGLHQSYVHVATGRSLYLVNGAEVFLAVSGATLGLVASRRAARVAAARLVRRVAVVWATVVAVSVLGALAWQLVDGGSIEVVRGDVLSSAVDALLLQRTGYYAGVLVLYVVYLAAAVPAVLLLHRGRTDVVLLVTAALYAWSQVVPGLTLPVDAFRALAGNWPVLAVPLVLSWHAPSLRARWATVGRRARRAGLVVLLAVVAGLGVLHAGGWTSAPWLGDALGYGADPVRGGLDLREQVMPPLALLVVAVHLAAMWGVVTLAWRPLRAGVGWLALPLGRTALFAFAAHAFLIQAWQAWTPLGWPGADARWLATQQIAVLVAALWLGCVARDRLARVTRGLPGGLAPRLATAGPLAATAGLVLVLAVAGVAEPGPSDVAGAAVD